MSSKKRHCLFFKHLVPVSRKTEKTISTCMVKQTSKLIKNVEKDIALKETLAEIRTELEEQHQNNTVSIENIIFLENFISFSINSFNIVFLLNLCSHIV